MNLRHQPLQIFVFSFFLLTAGCFGAAAQSELRPRSHILEGIAWIPQTWNNCGPATLAMALDRWGIPATQAQIAALIRPNPNDGHVSPKQIRYAAGEFGMDTIYVASGNIELVKTLLAADYAVLMPTWHIDESGSQMGHYRLLHGYDDESGTFAVRDSLEPEGHRMDYHSYDLLWRVFNRRMLVVYPLQEAENIRRILRDQGTEKEQLEKSILIAENERIPPGSLPDGMSASNYRAYSDFNRAMALTHLGRFSEAVPAIFNAFDLGVPWRMLWYQPEVLESVFEVGEYDWIISMTTRALDPYPYLEELWYWRGRAETALGRKDLAQEAFENALSLRPGWDLVEIELGS